MEKNQPITIPRIDRGTAFQKIGPKNDSKKYNRSHKLTQKEINSANILSFLNGNSLAENFIREKLKDLVNLNESEGTPKLNQILHSLGLKNKVEVVKEKEIDDKIHQLALRKIEQSKK